MRNDETGLSDASTTKHEVPLCAIRREDRYQAINWGSALYGLLGEPGHNGRCFECTARRLGTPESLAIESIQGPSLNCLKDAGLAEGGQFGNCYQAFR